MPSEISWSVEQHEANRSGKELGERTKGKTLEAFLHRNTAVSQVGLKKSQNCVNAIILLYYVIILRRRCQNFYLQACRHQGIVLH